MLDTLNVTVRKACCSSHDGTASRGSRPSLFVLWRRGVRSCYIRSTVRFSGDFGQFRHLLWVHPRGGSSSRLPLVRLRARHTVRAGSMTPLWHRFYSRMRGGQRTCVCGIVCSHSFMAVHGFRTKAASSCHPSRKGKATQHTAESRLSQTYELHVVTFVCILNSRANVNVVFPYTFACTTSDVFPSRLLPTHYGFCALCLPVVRSTCLRCAAAVFH